MKTKIERKSTVIAFGGGVVGDITSFATSITLRGVNLVQIPTTLLSQVDSSVGGKTAINSCHGKNLIGTFYQPKLVLIDTELLKTLPKRELLAGYAEVVKYGLIGDTEFFNWLQKNGEALIKGDEKKQQQAILKSCQAKADIVAEDEREKGQRALLNLGHTFGHAFEAETGYSNKLLHGEAVALGIIQAFRLSIELGHCPVHDLSIVRQHFEKVGLPTDPLNYLDRWDIDEMVKHMYSDKKVDGGKLVFILNRKIGESFIAHDIDKNKVKNTLAQIVSA